MAVSTNREKRIKSRDKEVEFESIQDEIERENQARRTAGTARTFVKGRPRRGR
jgi:hypothetical protein